MLIGIITTGCALAGSIGGGVIGSSIGIAVAGTAISGTVPMAVTGGALAALAGHDVASHLIDE